MWVFCFFWDFFFGEVFLNCLRCGKKGCEWFLMKEGRGVMNGFEGGWIMRGRYGGDGEGGGVVKGLWGLIGFLVLGDFGMSGNLYVVVLMI